MVLKHPIMYRTVSSQQTIIQPKMSIISWLRNLHPPPSHIFLTFPLSPYSFLSQGDPPILLSFMIAQGPKEELGLGHVGP